MLFTHGSSHVIHACLLMVFLHFLIVEKTFCLPECRTPVYVNTKTSFVSEISCEGEQIVIVYADITLDDDETDLRHVGPLDIRSISGHRLLLGNNVLTIEIPSGYTAESSDFSVTVTGFSEIECDDKCFWVESGTGIKDVEYDFTFDFAVLEESAILTANESVLVNGRGLISNIYIITPQDGDVKIYSRAVLTNYGSFILSTVPNYYEASNPSNEIYIHTNIFARNIQYCGNYSFVDTCNDDNDCTQTYTFFTNDPYEFCTSDLIRCDVDDCGGDNSMCDDSCEELQGPCVQNGDLEYMCMCEYGCENKGDCIGIDECLCERECDEVTQGSCVEKNKCLCETECHQMYQGGCIQKDTCLCDVSCDKDKQGVCVGRNQCECDPSCTGAKTCVDGECIYDCSPRCNWETEGECTSSLVCECTPACNGDIGEVCTGINTCEIICRDSNCLECSDGTSCDKCDDGYLILESSRGVINKVDCTQNCEGIGGHYVNGSSCVACEIANCLNCSIRNECSKCSFGYYLFKENEECYKVCPSGYYENYLQRECVSCFQNCEKCENGEECTGCKDFWYGENCTECSENFNWNCSACAEGYAMDEQNECFKIPSSSVERIVWIVLMSLGIIFFIIFAIVSVIICIVLARKIAKNPPVSSDGTALSLFVSEWNLKNKDTIVSQGGKQLELKDITRMTQVEDDEGTKALKVYASKEKIPIFIKYNNKLKSQIVDNLKTINQQFKEMELFDSGKSQSSISEEIEIFEK